MLPVLLLSLREPEEVKTVDNSPFPFSPLKHQRVSSISFHRGFRSGTCLVPRHLETDYCNDSP